ncbi:hypothetical protein [Morganella psychrotolerans]
MLCGACCACFRVSFYQGETDITGGVVPVEMTAQERLMVCPR